jgi:hypothetical protein
MQYVCVLRTASLYMYMTWDPHAYQHTRTCLSTQPHSCLNTAGTISKAANLPLRLCVVCVCTPVCVYACTRFCARSHMWLGGWTCGSLCVTVVRRCIYMHVYDVQCHCRCTHVHLSTHPHTCVSTARTIAKAANLFLWLCLVCIFARLCIRVRIFLLEQVCDWMDGQVRVCACASTCHIYACI